MVPYDGSSQANLAFKSALDIAKKHNSKVKIVTCIGSTHTGAWYVDARINKEIMRKAKNFAKEYISKLEDMAKQANIQIRSYIIETDLIIKQLLAFAESKKIDLIIMGNSGRGKFDTILLGSISNGISQRAKCPVLIVK